MSKRRFLVVAGFAESLLGFRAPLISALQSNGVEVHVAAPDLARGSPWRESLEAKNLIVHDIPLQRTGQNPMSDIKSLLALWYLMRCVRPEYLLGYTIKPVIYGTLAGWLAGVPHRFALITGLGYAFQSRDSQFSLRALVQGLYAVALTRAEVVFFQNPDDEALFRERRLLATHKRSCVVNGSGVDVSQFSVVTLPNAMSFLLIARLLGDKGIRQYVAAARQIKARFSHVSFRLVGWIDENPDAIREEELKHWVDEGVVEYLGRLSDVRPAIADCSVYVLPSYREGTPRTVLEAMAMGRPIITTDAPGCRETVVDADNGFLVPVKSVEALVAAMEKFIVSPDLVKHMGKRSREIAESKFDVNTVNAVMLREMGITGSSK